MSPQVVSKAGCPMKCKIIANRELQLQLQLQLAVYWVPPPQPHKPPAATAALATPVTLSCLSFCWCCSKANKIKFWGKKKLFVYIFTDSRLAKKIQSDSGLYHQTPVQQQPDRHRGVPIHHGCSCGIISVQHLPSRVLGWGGGGEKIPLHQIWSYQRCFTLCWKTAWQAAGRIVGEGPGEGSLTRLCRGRWMRK